jgi:hypothetical protein
VRFKIGLSCLPTCRNHWEDGAPIKAPLHLSPIQWQGRSSWSREEAEELVAFFESKYPEPKQHRFDLIPIAGESP